MKDFAKNLLSIASIACMLLCVRGYADMGDVLRDSDPVWGQDVRPLFPVNPVVDPEEEPFKDSGKDNDIEEFNLGGLNGNRQRGALNNSNYAENEIKKHLGARKEDEMVGVWVAPFFKHSHTHGLGSGSVARSNSYGSAFGLDVALGNLVLGGSYDGGWSKSTYSDRNNYSKDDSEFFGLTLYADWKRDQLRIYGGIGYFNEDHDMKMSNLMGRISSSSDIDTYAATVIAEYTFESECINIRPYVGVRYAMVDSDSYRVASGVTCDSDTQNVVRLPVGVKFDKSFEPWGGFYVRPVLDLCVEPALGDTKVDTKLRSGGSSSSEKSRVIDGFAYSAFLGATAGWEGIGFVVGYGYQGSAHEATHGVTCGFEWHF